jgi:hypothetical protein
MNKYNSKGFRLRLIGALLLLSNNLFGQQTYTENNQRIIPSPPNVAGLLKFNETPINNFNGSADVSIPLIEVKESTTHIPLTLSYHTGGIKVDEEASWVGLGWNLGVGGVIQEIIVGEPDIEYHGFDLGIYSTAPKPNSSVGNPSYNTFDGARNLIESGLCYRNGNGEVSSFTYNQVNQSNFEYDLFSFSFDGHTGKCIFPDQINGVCLDRQNIIFTKQNTPSTTITAITPDGTTYLFETIAITTTSRACDRPVKPDLKTRSWYLTKIIYPNQRQVSFSYTKTTSRTMPSLNENWTRMDYGATYNGYASTSISRSQTPSTVENLWLNEINFDNGKLKFISSTRLDMENTLKLDAIQLYKKVDPVNAVKEIKFFYNYFQSYEAPVGNDWTTNTTIVNGSLCEGQSIYLPSADFKRKRLKLLKVQISDGSTGPFPTYAFNYNGTELPVKTSFSKDLWGYYNGANSNTSSLPDYNNLGFWDPNVPYQALSLVTAPVNLANRKASAAYAQASMLKGIVYPTGAYTALRYESNQIAANELSSQNLFDNSAKVTDMTTGIQQKEFVVPSIGYQVYDSQNGSYFDGNPARIHINLFCCGYRGTTGCNNGYCLTYNPAFPNKGLYVKLEYFNPQNNQWTLTPDHTYDLSKNVIIDGYGDVDISEGLVPGKYRITANYPDDAPVLGDYSKTIASIMVTYKDFQTVTTPSKAIVGGLRVTGIVNYNSDGAISSQKRFSYRSGRLMVYPLFYRNYTPTNASLTLRANCTANQSYDNISNNVKDCSSNGALGDVPANFLGYNIYSLYSNPLLNYSYSANGSLVGYDSVVVVDGVDGQNGKTEFIYNNVPDSYDSFSALELPGTPTTPNLKNGSLKSQIEYRKVGQNFIPVKQTDFEYGILNPEIKWCFKSEYHSPMSYGWITPQSTESPHCDILPSDKFDPSQLILHFYPVKLGKLNLIAQTERTYADNNLIVSGSTFDYNNRLQLRRTTTINSEGQSVINENYYPSDYTTTSGVIYEMRHRNMIDYPIETINKLNTLTTSASYNEYYLHDNIISLNNLYSFSSPVPIATLPSFPGSTKDTHYEKRMTFQYDADGNLSSRQNTSGPIVNYLWDYDNTYPVAEVSNSLQGDMAYTSFEAENTGNWTIASAARDITKAITGTRSYSLASGNISKSGLTTTKSHIVSYWSKAGSATVNGATASVGPIRNGWTYFEHVLATGAVTVIVSGSMVIDELRLLPFDAQMTTLTHLPLIGTSSISDAKNQTKSYNYDSFQRLGNIKNQDGDLLKSFQYNYTSAYSTGTNTYYNSALSKVFVKSNCTGSNGMGTNVTYQVAAGVYSSSIHPGDANEMAAAEIEANGQYKADTEGACIPPACSTPIVVAANSGTGLNITVVCTGASQFASSQILFIKDPTTGEIYSNVSAPVSATSITAAVPLKGKTYRFVLMTTGQYCNGYSSDPVDIYIGN